MRIYLFHLPFSSSSFLVKRIGRKKKLNAGLGGKKFFHSNIFSTKKLKMNGTRFTCRNVLFLVSLVEK
jgi:hypothetical protein